MREEGKKNRNAKGNEKRKRGRMQEEWIDKEERERKGKETRETDCYILPPFRPDSVLRGCAGVN